MRKSRGSGKTETPAALYSQVLANAPKRVAHGELPVGTNGSNGGHPSEDAEAGEMTEDAIVEPSGDVADVLDVQPQIATGTDERVESPEDTEVEDNRGNEEDGPVHRPLIRASLPRHEGQPPPTRPIPEFTIRQPTGRQNRFRPRHQRGPAGGQHFGGNRGNGNFAGPPRGMRSGGGGRPPQGMSRRNGPGRKRSK